jgi:adenine-specific DNA-methyltransferase
MQTWRLSLSGRYRPTSAPQPGSPPRVPTQGDWVPLPARASVGDGVKYMGSKSAMLRNGLGELIVSEAAKAERVVDLFAGSAAVSWYAAQQTDRPVLAADLQHYSRTLARSVIARTHPGDADALARNWIEPARDKLNKDSRYKQLQTVPKGRVGAAAIARARAASADSEIPLVAAYGGYYYSPRQAGALQLLLDGLPGLKRARPVAHAALLMTAARCAAAPGHTAQPFGTSETALPYVDDAWRKDPMAIAKMFAEELAPLYAQVKGSATVSDAAQLAKRLGPQDLTFLDPPYSAVQYSRFYHVLEALSRESVPEVSGAGRYPALEDRPRSRFSLRSESAKALDELLEELAGRGCTVLLTFPAADCSNGLGGTEVIAAADRCYRDVTTKRVKTRFSTLGGNGTGRPARNLSDELILVMKRPR